MKKSYLDTLFGLENRVTIVTGGGGGLGRLIALRLAQSGARTAKENSL